MADRGRVLQATVAGHDAFWTNPDWDGAAWNVGGDRLWLGPEQNWFWTTRHSHDPADSEVQAGLDPGQWSTVEDGPGYCGVAQRVRVRHLHRNQSAVFDVTRSFTILDLDLPLFQQHVAYRTTASLSVDDGPDGELVSLWSLVQVPNGGVLEFPHVGPTDYRDYFEPVRPDHLGHADDGLTLRITGTSRHKIGLPPWVGNGRMAYSRPVEGGRLVVFRHFEAKPWLPYCDRPQGVDAGAGDAVQAYNDGGQYGGFGEVEHHSPAVVIGGRGAGGGITDDSLTVVGLVAERDWAEWRQAWLLARRLPVVGPEWRR
ncbi:MAG: hypothetical protein QOK43_547 [Acidimicrobiaceae bacterium]|nr:hypothetical protein [Acidimicrobiaceae bacterium]